MVTGVWKVAHPNINRCIPKTQGKRWTEQEMVNPQTVVGAAVSANIIPVGVNALVAVHAAQRVGPSLRYKAPKAFTAFGL